MKRGEIWTAAGGPDYAGKPRPVLIVQDDSFDATASIAICGLTSNLLEVALVRPAIKPSPDNNLRAPSRVMVDKVTTLARTKLGERVGKLTASDMAQVNRAMLVFLGLAGGSGG